MRNSPDIPLVFTPANEPYLGIKSLLWFDRIICWALAANTPVARWTRDNVRSLTNLQHAACQVIPQGISIALSIRELIRQAYLFSALVLMRPLIERAAVISYLDENPDAVSLWETGWKNRDRPSLARMIKAMAGSVSQEDAQRVCSAHNHIVHGDPMSCYQNLVHLPPGGVGYASGKILDNAELCDAIAMEAQCYLVVVAGRMSRIFPDVQIPDVPGERESRSS
jgi:hypothetical protein